ncbi:MAG: hypothetical protein JW712_00130 [Dehalococcoidales bacterium]|nr:hypothetical protein [Dehalococcoidales bacterium]
MSDTFFFVTGIVNSVALICLFLVRKKRMDIIQRFGKMYFLLAVPAVINIFLVITEHNDNRYIVFLALFLAFLLVEWLFDYVVKVDFRSNLIKNWKWTFPYLGLYYAMNYGFVVMPWKTHLTWGIVMLVLFVIQLVTNIRSHPKSVS